MTFRVSLSCKCCFKTRKSESNSQRDSAPLPPVEVVNAVLKLENLKAIHNMVFLLLRKPLVVNAVLKLENLKAIHNKWSLFMKLSVVVNAVLKLENLKAIHNDVELFDKVVDVVNAVLKLENPKAFRNFPESIPSSALPFNLQQMNAYVAQKAVQAE